MLSDAFAYIDDNGDRFLDELFALIRQPSISATGEGVAECAAQVLQAMSDAGMAAQAFAGEGHPFLYGEAAGPPGAPTVLVYGHYDVQPPDPVDQPHSPPFREFLEAGGYGDIEVKTHGMMTPWRTPVDHPAAGPVLRAVEKGFGAPPYRVPSLGGSLPLAEFTQLGRLDQRDVSTLLRRASPRKKI